MRVRPMGAAVAVAVIAIVAATGSSVAETVSPESGSSGTVVTVGGVTTCEGTAPTLTFATVDGTAIGAPVPFTPPVGTITVPDVADGSYRIALSCGAAEDSVPFTVVNAPPNFTG